MLARVLTNPAGLLRGRAFSVQAGRAEGAHGGPVSTTGEQADVKQRLVAELGRLVAQHSLGTPHLHASVPQPADQAGQLAVALEGVVAQVTAWRGRRGRAHQSSVAAGCLDINNNNNDNDKQ